MYKQFMDLRISGHFHQIVPIRFRTKWYIFSMSITACFHYKTDSLVDVTPVKFNSKKSPRRWKFRPTRYITISLRSIQRFQICKIPNGETGTFKIRYSDHVITWLIIKRQVGLLVQVEISRVRREIWKNSKLTFLTIFGVYLK